MSSHPGGGPWEPGSGVTTLFLTGFFTASTFVISRCSPSAVFLLRDRLVFFGEGVTTAVVSISTSTSSSVDLFFERGVPGADTSFFASISVEVRSIRVETGMFESE
jgi:hypothetical protein